jgi:hypothetical protein
MSNFLAAAHITNELISRQNMRGTRIINPRTGLMNFGSVPVNSHVPDGLIYLKLGWPGFGPNKTGAFGARHIWDKHRGEWPGLTPEQIPEKVLDILVPGADILLHQGAGKIITLNTSKGMVVLQEEREGLGFIYSVVTAYTRKDPKGIKIAQLQI